jgi:hypothetical protein
MFLLLLLSPLPPPHLTFWFLLRLTLRWVVFLVVVCLLPALLLVLVRLAPPFLLLVPLSPLWVVLVPLVGTLLLGLVPLSNGPSVERDPNYTPRHDSGVVPDDAIMVNDEEDDDELVGTLVL